MSTLDPPDCLACFEALPDNGKFLCCTGCSDRYHVGLSCSGVPENEFQDMGTARDSWTCAPCKKQASKRRVSSLSQNSMRADSLHQNSTVPEELAAISSAVTNLSVLPEKVDEIMRRTAAIEKLCLVRSSDTLRDFTDRLSSTYEIVLAKTNTHDAEVKTLHAKIQTLEKELKKTGETIVHLETCLNDVEQRSKMNNMVLCGFPTGPGEDLRSFMSELAGELDISGYSEDEITDIYRLPPKSGSPAPIVVQFTCLEAKERWAQARGKLRSLYDSKRVFSDDLTTASKELLLKARQVAKDKKYRFVWARNGKIFLRKEEGSKVLLIKHVSDLAAVK